MRLSSASIRSLLGFSSARKQATSYPTVTMARGSRGKGKTPRTETPSAPPQPSPPSPSDITMPIPSSTDPISQDCTNNGSQSSALVAPEPFEFDTLESSALAGPKIMKLGFSDSQDAQGLAISSFLDGEKPPAQATDDRQFSAKSKKRSKRKAKKANAQGQARKSLPSLLTSSLSTTVGQCQHRQPHEKIRQSPRPSPTLAPHQFLLLWPSLSQPRQRKSCDKKTRN